jgi:ABC-type glycerol-3-phosphate transport system substrate-binding protein
MKKKMKGMLAVLIAVSLILGITACSKGGGIGGNDPKSLAKETYQLFAKAMEAQGQKPGTLTFVMWASKEPQELQKLMEKTEALSKEGQKAYEDELEKLLDEADKKSGGK